MRKIEEYDNYCYYTEPQEHTNETPTDETDKLLLNFLNWDCKHIYRCDALKALSTIPLCDDCPHKPEEK